MLAMFHLFAVPGQFQRFAMTNMYDFIVSNSSYFNQLAFDQGDKIFIDYHCPLKDPKTRVWSHKNCLLYVQQGEKGYEALRQRYDSQKGAVFFVRKGGYILHQKFDKPYHALIFMFDDSAFEDLFDEHYDWLGTQAESQGFSREMPDILELPHTPRMKAMFAQSLEYINQEDSGSRAALSHKFKELMVNLLRERRASSFLQYLIWVCQAKDHTFLRLINDNSHLNFTTEELARTAGMSLSTFKRCFKKHFGMAPGQWLREQRLARARIWLERSDKSIAEIAFGLGYADVSSFSRAFKAKTGHAPTAFAKHGHDTSGE